MRALRDTLLAFGKRMVPLFYGRNQYAPVYTATLLEELIGLGYGDGNSAPNAVELSAADTVVAAAHEEVARFNAVLQTQLSTVNDQAKAQGRPPLRF